MGLCKIQSLRYQEHGHNHLRERITTECRSVTPGLVANILRDLGDRLQLCFDTTGNHIEHIL